MGYRAPPDGQTMEGTMPVVMKSKKMAYLSTLGVPEALIKDMQAVGITAHSTIKAIKFVDPLGVVLSSAPVTAKVVAKAQAQGLVGTEAALIEPKVSSAVIDALSAMAEDAEQKGKPLPGGEALNFGVQAAVSDAAALLGEDAVQPIPATSNKASKFTALAPSKMSGHPIKLVHATHLYQPVKSTSAGSVYFLIAARDDLHVACRCLGNKVSIRIEGDLQAYKKHIEGIGFATVDIKSDYVSMHVQTTNAVDMAKVVGSVIMSLGVAFKTTMPDMKIIAQKGVV